MNALSPAILIPVAGLIAFAASLIVSDIQSVSRANEALPDQSGPSLTIDDCIEADEGDVLQLQIRVSGVSDLLAWEILFAYDRHLIEVVDRQVREFLSEGPNSNVFDFSDPIPSSKGIYRLAAADIALGATAESGDGVLAILTLRALGKGISPAAIFRADLNGDGIIDLGPQLTAAGGSAIGDNDGDNLFDGTIRSGQIAIGESCSSTPPTPNKDDVGEIVLSPSTPTPTQVDGGTPDPSPDAASATADPDATATGPTSDTSAATGSQPTGAGPVPGGPSDSSRTSIGWIIALVAGVLATGLVVAYIVVRTTQRRI